MITKSEKTKIYRVSSIHCTANCALTLFIIDRYIVTLFHNRYQPASASELLSAFRALDPERTGTISRECMESALRHDGEPFEDEELEEMMSAAAVETAAGGVVIPYELYINKILVSLALQSHFCFKFQTTHNIHAIIH